MPSIPLVLLFCFGFERFAAGAIVACAGIQDNMEQFVSMPLHNEDLELTAIGFECCMITRLRNSKPTYLKCSTPLVFNHVVQPKFLD